MNIKTDQVEALRRQQEARAKPKPEQGGFDEVLAKEAERSQAQGASPPPLADAPGKTEGLESTGPVLAAEQAEALHPTNETATEATVMEHIDSLLDKWENYAQALKSPAPGDSLRQADSVLGRIEGDVERLKQTMPEPGQDDSPLKSMVDELEIMAVTERIKLNRGDYL